MADNAIHGFTEGQLVWVEDGDGKHHPGVFVGDNENAGWFGGGPSAYVVHPEAKQAEVVSIFRITPRDGGEGGGPQTTKHPGSKHHKPKRRSRHKR